MNLYDLKLFQQNMMKKKAPETNDKSKNILINNDKFAVVEAYKIARSNLMFAVSAKNNKFVVFTSYNKGEGKSTSITNMAISVSKMGVKVLLIDADMRKPNIHNLLKLKNDIGLSELLGKFRTPEEVIKKDLLPNLDVITAGTIPPNPSELLGSQQLETMFKRFSEEYDFVLIDSPPIGIVTDALMLKDQVAGYVLIVREKHTTHNDIAKMLSSLELAEADALGFMKIGCVQKDKKYYNRYYNRYRYGY
ncbi:MAG: CpsD/CapB family tyrosine-protein kinase [Clostridia bacterium]|nr:CpsD/CapB family tyrosine-protein kinase [Clostridia bacterium]